MCILKMGGGDMEEILMETCLFGIFSVKLAGHFKYNEY
jgi:hypothetical protein